MSCPSEPTPLHPDCLHPISNMQDDYAGVECCMCSGSPCINVTPPLAYAHADFITGLCGDDWADAS